MPRPKRFNCYMDEVDWSCDPPSISDYQPTRFGHGYRIRIPYVDATGVKRIYHQSFSTRELGLTMDATKRLALA